MARVKKTIAIVINLKQAGGMYVALGMFLCMRCLYNTQLASAFSLHTNTSTDRTHRFHINKHTTIFSYTAATSRTRTENMTHQHSVPTASGDQYTKHVTTRCLQGVGVVQFVVWKIVSEILLYCWHSLQSVLGHTQYNCALSTGFVKSKHRPGPLLLVTITLTSQCQQTCAIKYWLGKAQTFAIRLLTA